jgi:hypothetical protein
MRNLIPDYMIGGIERWIDHGIEPGGFLMAVLCNNLKEAVCQADDTNINLLPAYISFFYNDAPSQCWGSPEKVLAWKLKKEAERL